MGEMLSGKKKIVYKNIEAGTRNVGLRTDNRIIV